MPMTGVCASRCSPPSCSRCSPRPPPRRTSSSAGHSDWRGELAFADVAGTVETVDRAAGTEDEGLPLTWCGDERTSDDVAPRRATPPTLAQFKVVYAYASDRAEPLRRLEGRAAGRRVADRALHGRPVRRPQGAALRHGHELRARLRRHPGRRAARARARPTPTTSTALKAAVAAAGRPRCSASRATRSCSPTGCRTPRPATGPGSARATSHEARGSASPHNNGGLFAALWVPDAEAAPGANPDGWWAEGMLHELSHNLGAVGDSAPHSSGYGHCYDGYDVMCYHDDPAAPAMTYPCPQIPGVMSQVYDCGGDDYFNVAPAAGTLPGGPTGTSTTTASWPPAPTPRRPAAAPRPRDQPAAAGLDHPAGDRRRRRASARCSPRSPARWTNAPTAFEYQWEQGDGTTWLAVPGATGATYAVTGGRRRPAPARARDRRQRRRRHRRLLRCRPPP